MKMLDDASKGRMVLCSIFFTLIIFSMFYTFRDYNKLSDENKEKIASTTLSASLGLASFSLSIIAYSLSRINSLLIKEDKLPFERLVNIVYILILMSLSEAGFSLVYLVSTYHIWFFLTLLFIYVLILFTLVALSYWVEKELAWED